MATGKAGKDGQGLAETALASEGGAIADGAHTDAGAAPPQLDPEVLGKITTLRSHLRESSGKVVMAMMMMPRYRQQTLADLGHLVLDPLIQNRIAIAYNADNGAPEKGVAGIAVWASLSDEAEGRLRDQIKGGNWPIRLRGEDWNSGNNNWLIDVIAPDKKAAAAVIANFKQVVKEGELKLHPLITQLIDKATLEQMGARRDGGAPTATANFEGSAAVN
ncbi:MAG: toxin-activating lysine-acyltransferase [Hyphomicrobium sp.]